MHTTKEKDGSNNFMNFSYLSLGIGKFVMSMTRNTNNIFFLLHKKWKSLYVELGNDSYKQQYYSLKQFLYTYLLFCLVSSFLRQP